MTKAVENSALHIPLPGDNLEISGGVRFQINLNIITTSKGAENKRNKHVNPVM
jgi:hypothetical protein